LLILLPNIHKSFPGVSGLTLPTTTRKVAILHRQEKIRAEFHVRSENGLSLMAPPLL